MTVAARRAARWRPAVGAPRADAARAAAEDVLARLRDPDAAEAAGRAGTRRGRPHWTPYSTAQGGCGLALAFGHLDRCRPGEGWDLVAHRHLARAVERTARDPVTGLGLFAGLAGMAFTTAYLAGGQDRYRSLLDDIDRGLYDRIPHRIPGDDGQGLAVGTFDLVSGWTGVAAYLHSRPPGPERNRTLATLLARLVDLCRAPREPDGMPAWHTPHALIADDGMRARYPAAIANCGLAHGVTGPLALLALAHADGPVVPGTPRRSTGPRPGSAPGTSTAPGAAATRRSSRTRRRATSRAPPNSRPRRRRPATPGATAVPASPAPCGWPAPPWATAASPTRPPTPCGPSSPARSPGAGSTRPASATASRACCRSPSGSPPTPGRDDPRGGRPPGRPAARRVPAAIAVRLPQCRARREPCGPGRPAGGHSRDRPRPAGRRHPRTARLGPVLPALLTARPRP
ncbi:hypothetical protein ATKI12_4470 [Kitasatospora sp. Ki12]